MIVHLTTHFVRTRVAENKSMAQRGEIFWLLSERLRRSILDPYLGLFCVCVDTEISFMSILICRLVFAAPLGGRAETADKP
jgi:hypothetical protein